MRTVVFLGPTLPADRARRILPDAVYLPPAAQADVVSALRRWEPDVIALIDGTFLHTLAVWHKEILHALDLGVAVYGAASMGALRACECARFGMVGVGRIFDDYASGVLTDDDEVALAHGDADDGWRPHSEPMVNIRSTLRAAVAAGMLSTQSEDRIVAAGKSLYFPDRTWPSALAVAVKEGLSSSIADGLAAFVADHRVDQKAADAEELLKLIAVLDSGSAPSTPSMSSTPSIPSAPSGWVFNDSRPSRGLRGRDVHVRRGPGEVPLEAISRHVMLHRPGATELLERACARDLQLTLADILRIEATEEEVSAETDRFRLRRELHSDTDLDTYLERNDLTLAELIELMRQLAVLRRLRAWQRVRRYRLGLGSLLLDELRLLDDYAPWADHAATQEAFAESVGEPADVDPLGDLVREQLAVTAWQPDCAIETWAEEADFGDVYQAHAALARARAVRRHIAAISANEELWAAVGSAIR